MPAIQWDESFKLGIEPIDHQHHHLVQLLNRTYDEFIARAPAETIELVLDQLIDYATYHFDCEEYLMSESSFLEAAEHKVEHERFSRRVVEIQKNFYAGEKHLSLEILSFLKNWLTGHILKNDRSFGRFCACQPYLQKASAEQAVREV